MRRTRSDASHAAKHRAAWLAEAQRDYDRAERALVKAALVGHGIPGDASSSARKVDLTREVEALRWAANELAQAKRGR